MDENTEKFIKKLFGSKVNLAKVLNLSYGTVKNATSKNDDVSWLNLLKYIAKMEIVNEAEFKKLNNLCLSYSPNSLDVSEYKGRELILLNAIESDVIVSVNKHNIKCELFHYYCP